jgi:hypothetical protein
MRLAELLDRCLALEERAAALYRGFAATRRDDAELAALWTALAADEDAHARSIGEAQGDTASEERDLVAVEGCTSALADVADRLWRAESLEPDAPSDRQLAAALDLELSELEALRRLALVASDQQRLPRPDSSHLRRLADTARRRTQDDHVRLAAALLLARERLVADLTNPTGWGTRA